MNSLAYLAFMSPVLMDAVLGISALFLRTLHPHEPIYVHASHRYALLAIRECSSQIHSSVGDSNAGALFLVSMLIAFHGFPSRHSAEGAGDSSADMQSLQWLRVFQGVRPVKEAWNRWIRANGGHLGLLFNSLRSRFSKREGAKDQFLGVLLEGVELEEGIDVETRAMYKDAVSYLSCVHNNEQLRGLLGLSGCHVETVCGLDDRDPKAFAVVGNWLALLRMHHLSSFLKGARERELDEIMQAFPQEWWPKMS